MLKAVPFRTVLASLVGLFCMDIGVVTPGDLPPRLPRDNLLVYRGADSKPVPVKTVEDWAKRRGEVVRGMESVIGTLPDKEKRSPLDLKIEEEVDGGTYVRRLGYQVFKLRAANTYNPVAPSAATLF